MKGSTISMTDEQRLIAKVLATECVIPPGSASKKFVRDMAHRAREEPDYELSDKQVEYLYDLLHRFRRQIPGPHETYCTVCPPQGRLFK